MSNLMRCLRCQTPLTEQNRATEPIYGVSWSCDCPLTPWVKYQEPCPHDIEQSQQLCLTCWPVVNQTGRIDAP